VQTELSRSEVSVGYGSGVESGAVVLSDRYRETDGCFKLLDRLKRVGWEFYDSSAQYVAPCG
jgi:hypothetical protein